MSIDEERKHIREIIHRHTDLNDEMRDDLVDNIVNGCHIYINFYAKSNNIEPSWNNPQYLDIFNSTFYHIKIHLDPESLIKSRMLLDNILLFMEDNTKGINPAYIASRRDYSLAPNIHKFIEEMENRVPDEVEENVSSRYTCNACGMKRTRLKTVQLRAADEESNTSITCVNCGNNWIH